MEWDAMLREYVGNERVCHIYSSDVVCSWNKHTFLRESVDDYEDSSESVGGRELFDEIHADGVPWMFWYWKWLEETVGTMMRGLVVCA